VGKTKMSKTKTSVPAIREAAQNAGLIAKAWDRLETEASRAMQEANGTTVQIVAANGHTTAHIRSPGLRVVLQDGAMAIEASGQVGEGQDHE
jgi:hypothetical protein